MISSFLLLHLIIIIIITFFFFFIHVKAQNPPDSTEGNPSQDSTGNFQPSLAVVVAMLSIMFSLTFILLLYAKFCHRASAVRTMSHQTRGRMVRSRSGASGIDRTLVESLPLFRFSSLKGSREGLECSVCLAKFEDVEILRLLPKCRHAFHIDCIDQWLENHSTCPLCRRKVSLEDLPQQPYSPSLRCLWNQTELREESNIELYVQREDSRHGSSRFSIGSSFRKADRVSNKDEECLPMPQSMDSDEPNKTLHKFNHEIIVSDVVLRTRWSDVSSTDLMFLNSEMLNEVSSARFSTFDCPNHEPKTTEITETAHVMNIKDEMERKRAFESKLMEIRQIDRNSVTFPGLPTTSSHSKEINTGLESNVLNHNNKRSFSEIVVHPRFRESKSKDLSVAETNMEEERRRRTWLPIARKTVQWFASRERIRPSPSQGLNLRRLDA